LIIQQYHFYSFLNNKNVSTTNYQEKVNWFTTSFPNDYT